MRTVVNVFLHHIAWLLSLSIVAILPAISSAQMPEFDVPLKKEMLDLGPSPVNPQRTRIKLSCYTYATFMITEYDLGQKGAEWTAITPVDKDANPICSATKDQSTKMNIGQDSYYWGVKGKWVFFASVDDNNGGMGFAVFDLNTKVKVFGDIAYESTRFKQKVAESPFNHVRIVEDKNALVSLKYLRVVGDAECDLHKDSTSCWGRAVKKFHLQNLQMPTCTGYSEIADFRASVIAYPVKISLAPTPVTTIIAGPVECWPIE